MIWLENILGNIYDLAEHLGETCQNQWKLIFFGNLKFRLNRSMNEDTHLQKKTVAWKKGGDETGESDANPHEWPNEKMSQNEAIQQSNLIPICRNFAAFHPFHPFQWSMFQELPIPKIQEELLFPAGGYLTLDGQSLRSSGERHLKRCLFDKKGKCFTIKNWWSVPHSTYPYMQARSRNSLYFRGVALVDSHGLCVALIDSQTRCTVQIGYNRYLQTKKGYARQSG